MVTWLMTPPVEPRPKASADGPFRTSMRSMLKRSRLYSPMSRTASRKRSPPAGKPRSQKTCEADTPPSAAVNVIPGTLRSASCSDVSPCCRITGSGTMFMNCGMSRSGVSTPSAVDVDSVLNSESGVLVTLTSGSVCVCCPIAEPENMRTAAAAMGRFVKRDMVGTPRVLAGCRFERACWGVPGWPLTRMYPLK